MAKKQKSPEEEETKKQIIYTTIRLSRCAAGKNQFDFCSPFLGLSWEISNYPCKTTFAQDPPKIKTWNLTNFKQRIF
jgi:hypothetical protein